MLLLEILVPQNAKEEVVANAVWQHTELVGMLAGLRIMQQDVFR
jgi:hypothetical protein